MRGDGTATRSGAPDPGRPARQGTRTRPDVSGRSNVRPRWLQHAALDLQPIRAMLGARTAEEVRGEHRRTPAEGSSCLRRLTIGSGGYGGSPILEEELTWITERKSPSHRCHSRYRSPHHSRIPPRSRSRSLRRLFPRRPLRRISRRSRRPDPWRSPRMTSGMLRAMVDDERTTCADLGLLDELNLASVAGSDTRRARSTATCHRRDRYPHAGRGPRGNSVGRSTHPACRARTSRWGHVGRRLATRRDLPFGAPTGGARRGANDRHRSGDGSTGPRGGRRGRDRSSRGLAGRHPMTSARR